MAAAQYIQTSRHGESEFKLTVRMGKKDDSSDSLNVSCLLVPVRGNSQGESDLLMSEVRGNGKAGLNS